MSNENSIKVWDLFVRIFHISLLASVVVAYAGEEGSMWHIYAGYTVLGLIILRVLWGIVGSKYARFSNFIYSPGTVINYLKGLRNKKPKHYIGHNPAAGVMVITLLVTLFAVTISGLKVYAIEEGRGPLAENKLAVISSAYADSDHNKLTYSKDHDDNELWEEIHEASAHFLLFLIFLHILGVTVSSKLHNENLVKAMITGNKEN